MTKVLQIGDVICVGYVPNIGVNRWCFRRTSKELVITAEDVAAGLTSTDVRSTLCRNYHGIMSVCHPRDKALLKTEQGAPSAMAYPGYAKLCVFRDGMRFDA